ncbi:MAG: polyprenyl synthetase family protein [Myxococcaceae bacterium]|nr:polyprenyl synthetase family protein [Myxococcaceae bacterium]
MAEGFSLEGWLAAQKARVEALLANRLERLRAQTPPRLFEAMGYSLLDGGKRLRPVLCLAFAEAVSGQTGGGGAVAEDAACALEYVHTYSLVHDDLPAMDDDALRRGRPTNHKVYGEALAILAGDALLTEAFALAAGGSEPVRAALVLELARGAGAAGMVGGQVLDIAEDRPAALDYLTRLHRLKTGALIRAACRMGAVAGGGGARELEIADRYGDAVGLAFQIADDVLDVTATAAELGKPTGADAAAGRFTYPAVVGLERARQLAQEEISRALSAVKPLEPGDGPLAALARYAVERTV